MKICNACGAQISDGETICKFCGSVVELTQHSEPKSKVLKVEEVEKETLSLKYKDFLDNEALYRIGLCKLSGVGVEKSEAEAFQIFQMLAYRGHLDSMFQLAEMCEQMDPPELEMAVIWLKIAADNGHEPSKIKLRALISLVKPEVYENKPIEIPRGDSRFENLVRQALPHVVLIRAVEKGTCQIVSEGAGFIVQGGYIITNYHVIDKKEVCIYAKFEPEYDKIEHALNLCAIFPEYDIAVLTFTELLEKKISSGDHLHLRPGKAGYGEEVYTIGNPLGYGFSVSKGVISCPDRKFANPYPKAVDTVIQVDITANHGNSGGALLDQYNNVLGILTFIPGDSGGGITMCVPAKYIVEALNRL